MKKELAHERTRAATMESPRSTLILLYTVYFIYFFNGLTLCFESVFLPEFKEYFHLNYQQQMYTMFAKNIPFLLAVAIGLAVKRIGYKNCMTIAMLLFAAGTLALVPGLRTGHYVTLLLGFFVIGVGFNFQLVAGNPMLAALGPENGSSSRLNLGNALGAVAQIIAPATLSFIIPITVVSVEGKLPYMEGLFVVLGVVLAAAALVTLIAKNVDIAGKFQQVSAERAPGRGAGTIWAHPRVTLGFAAIFLILGAEAGLFGLYRNYLEDPSIVGLSSHQSQRLFTVFFAVFALGRVAASWMQKRMRPATHLAIHIIAAMLCLCVVMLAKGTAAAVAITAIGFFVSIFFPTLYSLAIKNMGDLTGPASGLLTMGFVGCALLPVLQGKLADSIGLQYSFVVGLAAYLFAAFYTLRVSKEDVVSRPEHAGPGG